MRKLTVGIALIVAPASAENWPNFRGPSRQGVSTEKAVPQEWSATKNVAWRAEIPGLGWSSPVVWGDRIFLTSALEDGASCHVLAVDARNGRIVWDREVFRQTVSRKEKKNSFATPTPASDGKRVYAVFADGSIVALDFTGKVVWTNREYRYYSQHGIGASPVLWRDLLIMPFDPSSEGEDKKVGWQKPWDKSFVVALDTRTGKERWRTPRGLSRIGHVTPNIATVGGRDVLVSGAGDVIQGYDLRTGERLWSLPSQGEGVVPSVVVGGGMAFTSSGFEKTTMRAVRLGPKPEIAWEQTRGVPRVPSFAWVAPWLFTVTEAGIAMAVQGATGEILWQERLGGEFSASPLVVGGNLYMTSETCETTVLKAAGKFEVVAKNALGQDERCQASPAVSRGRIYLRSDRALWAIGGAATQ